MHSLWERSIVQKTAEARTQRYYKVMRSSSNGLRFLGGGQEVLPEAAGVLVVQQNAKGFVVGLGPGRGGAGNSDWTLFGVEGPVPSTSASCMVNHKPPKRNAQYL